MKLKARVNPWLLVGATATIVIGYSTISLGSPVKTIPKSPTCCTFDTSEEPTCIETVDVEAGALLNVKAINSSNAFESGYWEADWGTIDQSGHYTAPTFRPPAGFDTIKFVSNGNTDYKASLYIIQKPGVPWTAEPETALPEDFYEDQNSTGPTEMTPPLGDDEEFASTDVVDEIEISESDYDRDNFDLNSYADSLVINGITYSEVVTRADDDDIELLVESPAPLQKRKKCAVLPAPSWINSPCTNGKVKTVVGKTKKVKKGAENSVNITLSFSAGGWGVGTNVTYQRQTAFAYYYKDFYKCVNGKWTYIKTIKCVWTGSYARSFSPGGSVVAKALGFSDDPGYKFNKSVPPECDTF